MWSEIGFVKYKTKILEQLLDMEVQQASKHSSLFLLGRWPTQHILLHKVQIPVIFHIFMRFSWYKYSILHILLVIS